MNRWVEVEQRDDDLVARPDRGAKDALEAAARLGEPAVDGNDDVDQGRTRERGG